MHRLTISIAIATILASASVRAGEVFEYTNTNGVISFTDEAKRVPAMHEATVVPLGAWRGFTHIENAPPVMPTPIPTAARRSFEEECGTITVRTERRNVGDLNKRFYIAEDACGILFDAPYYPELNSITR